MDSEQEKENDRLWSHIHRLNEAVFDARTGLVDVVNALVPRVGLLEDIINGDSRRGLIGLRRWTTIVLAVMLFTLIMMVVNTVVTCGLIFVIINR